MGPIGAPSEDSWAVPREEAIPRLVDRHGGRLLGLARRICGDPLEAEDLVQEIFLQAWRKWDQFDGRSDPITWLYTIAHRACQRMHRPRAGQPERMLTLDESLPFEAAALPVPAPRLDGYAAAERQERIEAVERALGVLPDEFRMPLVLKDLVGFTLAEIAAILGVPEATVKTRVHRARLKLRHALVEGMDARPLPPVAYPPQVCLDLLRAKQEALDRGREMPNADEIICERCRAVFASLDLTRDVCRVLGDARLTEQQRASILARALSA